MIEGINLQLKPPIIYFKSRELTDNEEVNELLEDLRKYFEQKHRIYDAELILSNNEYKRHQGDFGTYYKREDVEIKLRFLTEITLENDRITFKCDDAEKTIPILKDFFYFIEWEDEYYQ